MNKKFPLYIALLGLLVLLFVSEKAANAQLGGKQTEIYPIIISTQKGYEVQKELVHKAAITAISQDPNFSYQKGNMAMHSIKATHLNVIDKAEKLFDDAFALYDDLDMNGAIQKAEKALEKLELGAAFIDDLSLAVKILHLIGACHTLNGDLNSASEAFLRAHAINPSMKPDANIFPPDIIDVFDAVGQGAGTVGTGSISVKSDPKGASVYLDGMPMGVTPVTIDNVLVGKHIIRLSKTGYQHFGSVMSIEKGKVKGLDATLQQIPGISRIIKEIDSLPNLFAEGIDSTLPSLNTIAKDLGVEQLLVVLMSPGEGQVVSLSLLVYDRLTNSYVAQRQGDCPSMSDQVLLPKAEELSKSTLLAALAKETGTTGKVTTISQPVVPKEKKKKKKTKGVASKWWFWVALFAGVGVVAGGSYLGYAGATGQLGPSGPGGSGGTGDIIIEF